MRDISAGVIGVGKAGEGHLKNYNSHGDVIINDVCEPNEERAEQLRNSYNLNVFDTAERMFEEATNSLDLVSICSPPPFHFEQAKCALKNGANVLIEKPMVVSIDQANKLYQYGKEYDCEICVNHSRIRKGGLTKKAIEAANSGEIGDIISVKELRYLPPTRFESDSDHWCHDLTGGRFTEHLSHHIYPSYKMIGEMELVNIEAEKTIDQFPWLDFNKISLNLEGNKKGTDVSVNILVDPNIEEDVYDLIIIGTKGIIHDRKGRFLIKYRDKMVNVESKYYSTKILDDLRGQFKQNIQNTIYNIKWSIDALIAKLNNDIGLNIESNFISSSKSAQHQYIDYLMGEDEIPVPWDEAHETIRLNLEVANKLESLPRSS